RGDHRRVPRPPQSDRHRACRPFDVAALSQRRGGAARTQPAVFDHRPVSGHASAAPARRRNSRQLPDTDHSREAGQPGSGVMMDALVPILTAILIAGTPLVFAALGELVTEKSGVLNLGVEGMMLIGAVTGFVTALSTGSVWLGMAVAALCGALSSVPFAFLVLTLRANQVASGLALAILGTGVSAFIGKPYVGVALVKAESGFAAFVREIPLVGDLLAAIHPVVYLSWLI